MTNYKFGDIVLISFIFSEGTGQKKRPALVLSTRSFSQKRGEIIVSAITSNTSRILPGDTLLKEWQNAGLLFPSTATAIIQTFKSKMATKKLGSMANEDLEKIRQNLSSVLKFINPVQV